MLSDLILFCRDAVPIDASLLDYRTKLAKIFCPDVVPRDASLLDLETNNSNLFCPDIFPIAAWLRNFWTNMANLFYPYVDQKSICTKGRRQVDLWNDTGNEV